MDRIENAQMNSQGTRKLYYENVHQTDFTAVVMECVPDKEEGYYRIVLDASAFFPENLRVRPGDAGRTGRERGGFSSPRYFFPL